MRAYIGAKVIMAEPEEKDGMAGYRVVYPDGYVSWSPKGVFEEAYRPVSTGEKLFMRDLGPFEDKPEELPPLGVHVSETIKFKAD